MGPYLGAESIYWWGLKVGFRGYDSFRDDIYLLIFMGGVYLGTGSI